MTKAPQETSQAASARRRQPSRNVASAVVPAAPSGLVDHRPEALAQRQSQALAQQSPQVQALVQLQARINNSPRQVAQRQHLARLFGQSVQEPKAMMAGSPRQRTRAFVPSVCPVLRGPVVQRFVTVKNIDFDPVHNKPRDGYIKQEVFSALQSSLKNDKGFTLFVGQLQNVIQAISQKDFEAPDVHQLADAIRNAVVQALGQKNLYPNTTVKGIILQHAITAITENIQADHSVAMDQSESQAYDQLTAIVGRQAMSRAKGTPSNIAYNQLPTTPTNLKSAVDAILGQIRTENGLWTTASLQPQLFLQTLHAMPRIRTRVPGYQGNHTNNAGWLPTVTTPLRTLQTITQHVNPRIWRIMQDPQAADRLSYTGIHINANDALRLQYEAGIQNAYGGMGNADAKCMAWAELAQGVSAYIEFHIPGGISRLVFDPVNQCIYVSAHYKWRQGYNPWFQVTGVNL